MQIEEYKQNILKKKLMILRKLIVIIIIIINSLFKGNKFKNLSY